MKNSALIVLGILATLSSAQAFDFSRLYQQKIEARIRNTNLGLLDAVTDPSLLFKPAVASKTFTQKLDHSSKSDKRTFEQRYFTDFSAQKSEDSPVFYDVCGEGACDQPSGAVVAWAKAFGGSIVSLEHRYYGKSVPVADYSAENLQYLSVEQALADLSAFQEFAKNEFNLKGKWIALGGSYPAALAAFYRQKSPDNVVGALASSGPVEARAKFEEYDHHVANVVTKECLAAIQSSVSEIETRLKDRQSAEEVKALFRSSVIKDEVDFLYVVADMAAIAIQYGMKDKLCKAITSTKDPVSAYAKVGLEMFDWFGITPVEDTPQGNMSTDPSKYAGGVGFRQWLYQSCTQFGYWQVAYHDQTESARSSRIDLKYHDQLCERLFGIKQTVDYKATNDRYYDMFMGKSVSNVFFTNGSNDPWMNLSIAPERGNVKNPNIESMTIEGAAHCDDLGTSQTAALKKARTRFKELVETWIGK